MQYGMPRNFRAPRAREDNKGRPTKYNSGLKKFGVRLTEANQRRWWPRWRHAVSTHWYKKEKGRDAAYNHYLKKPQYFDADKLEFEKVEKVSR